MDEKTEAMIEYMLQAQDEMFEAIGARKGSEYLAILHRTANAYSAVLWAAKDVSSGVRQDFVHAAACVVIFGTMELQMLWGRLPTKEEVEEFNGYIGSVSNLQVKSIDIEPEGE